MKPLPIEQISEDGARVDFADFPRNTGPKDVERMNLATNFKIHKLSHLPTTSNFGECDEKNGFQPF